MANHVVLTAPDDVPHHVNNVAEGTITDKSHGHDVFDVARHLNSKTGEKGASVTQSLHELANPDYDTEAHFTNAPKDMRAHLKMGKER